MGQKVAFPGVHPRGVHVLAAWLVVAALVALMGLGGFLRSLDQSVQDSLTRAWASPQRDVSPVVLVDIDEASLAQLGPWPWPRSLVADLVTRLRQKGARIQGWDVHFPEPAPGDDKLSAALNQPAGPGAAGPDTVIGQVLILDPQVERPPRAGSLRPSALAPDLCANVQPPISGHLGVADSLQSAVAGHLTATPDPDGGLRRLPAVLCEGPRRYPQLVLAMAQLWEPSADWRLRPGSPLWGPAQWLERGSLRFAVSRDGLLTVPYRQPHNRWTAVSAVHVLDGTQTLPDLAGKAVIIGATAVGLADTVATPFHANAPGVSVHAELMSAALEGAWLLEPAHPLAPALLIWGLLSGLLILLARALQKTASFAVASVLVAALPLVLAWAGRASAVVLPVAAPTAGLVCFAFVLVALQIEAVRKQARALAGHLESFLPRDLAREIVRQNPSSESLGQPASGVVLALRVAGLDRWCASVDSLKALGLVHAVSSLAQRHSQQHGGQLQHMQADVFLLTWTVADLQVQRREPVQQPSSLQPQPLQPQPPPAESLQPEALQQAVHQAAQAARTLLVEIGALVSRMETERHPLGVRSAIEAGPFLLAVAGSSHSRRSLLLGPAVDVAVALLPLCEELASPLLLGQRAAGSQTRLSLHQMGHFLLPDSGQPQAVYRLEP